MAWINPLAEEYQRRRFTRPDGDRYLRADAYRLAAPGTPEAKPPGWLDPSATRVRLKEAQEEEARERAAAEWNELEREVWDMRTLVGHLKSYLALSREAQRSTSLRTQADRALERFNRAYAHYFAEDKAGFNPNQSRAPKGDPDGGQWVRDAGRDGSLVTKPAAMRRGPSDKPLPLHLPLGKPAGPEVPRPRITIINNAQTGMSTVDGTTEKLRTTLEDVVNKLPDGSGSRYGTRVHTEFANAVRDQNLPGIGHAGVEQTFPLRQPYGSADSVRTDITLRDDSGEPIAIYDVKTGGATLTTGRVSELLRKSNANPAIPVIEMHVRRGLSLKARVRGPIESWIILMRVWRPGLPDIADLAEGEAPF
jgi:hypothetical protein